MPRALLMWTVDYHGCWQAPAFGPAFGVNRGDTWLTAVYSRWYTKLPRQPLCDQLDPNPHPHLAMVLKTPTYLNSHYAAQNRKEMGAAISKNSCELDSTQFKAVLDVYDQSWHKHKMSSLFVPNPDTMIAKLKARKNQIGKVHIQEEGLGECCEYLNELMGRLPGM